MARRPDDICARGDRPPTLGAEPQAAPIYPTAVWRCESTEHAEQLMSGDQPGYCYQREGHPNADLLCEKLAELHGSERAVAVASGMSALAAAALALLKAGDHVVVSNQLYGLSALLLEQELARWGVTHTTRGLRIRASGLRDSSWELVFRTKPRSASLSPAPPTAISRSPDSASSREPRRRRISRSGASTPRGTSSPPSAGTGSRPTPSRAEPPPPRRSPSTRKIGCW